MNPAHLAKFQVIVTTVKNVVAGEKKDCNRTSKEKYIAVLGVSRRAFSFYAFNPSSKVLN